MNSGESAKTDVDQQTSIMRLVLFSLKRTILTAPYWTDVVQTFKYFMKTRQNRLSRHPIIWFRYETLLFGVRPIDWYIVESIILQQEYAA
ncbi:MAG: hypothetical protein L7F78_09915 [Syntrophales bacterium LBB04]|nr:hypothetical protein [Syntrophales bacterium LBB04]